MLGAPSTIVGVVDRIEHVGLFELPEKALSRVHGLVDAFYPDIHISIALWRTRRRLTYHGPRRDDHATLIPMPQILNSIK